LFKKFLKFSLLIKIHHKGNYINVSGDFDPIVNEGIIDNNSRHFLILNPDTLLSATQVADVFDCPRKAVLQTRVRAGNEVSEAMVLGKMLHDVLQQSLVRKAFSIESLRATLKSVIEEGVDDLFAIGMDELEARKKMDTHLPKLQEWGKKVLGNISKVRLEDLLYLTDFTNNKKCSQRL
jgi:DNA replication ATP-dependent helicase Dna2